MSPDFDIVVLGSGFGGSLLSMVARRLGLSVLLVERSAHPRFAIGESTSPLTNLLLEQLAVGYDLPFLLPLTTFGDWQRTYPEIGCGLKRGFTYYAHKAGEPFRAAPDRSTQLLVAASPKDEVSDMHWLRADVDHFLMRRAVELGVIYTDRTEVTGLDRTGEGIWRLSGQRDGAPFNASARLLIDATGPRGCLHRLWGLPETTFPDYPATRGLFTHFTNVQRCDAMEDFATDGVPPYPPDDAALHHVFDGGWMWALRFGNGITSAGFSITDALAGELGLPGDPEAAWQRFLQRFPSIQRQFVNAQPIRPFVYSPRLSYRTSQAAGSGWALLPSAAAFIDPLFSTGIPLTLLGIERLGRVLAEIGEPASLDSRLSAYGELTLAEADSTAAFIGAGFRAMPCFPVFAAFSLFYFAAASYSEMARRLAKPHLVTRFLAADRTDFRSGMDRCLQRLPSAMTNCNPSATDAFASLVAESIACLNVAGLADPGKRNWYGVDLEDVVRNAAKLELAPEQARAIIATAPWAQ